MIYSYTESGLAPAQAMLESCFEPRPPPSQSLPPSACRTCSCRSASARASTCSWRPTGRDSQSSRSPQISAPTVSLGKTDGSLLHVNLPFGRSFPQSVPRCSTSARRSTQPASCAPASAFSQTGPPHPAGTRYPAPESSVPLAGSRPVSTRFVPPPASLPGSCFLRREKACRGRSSRSSTQTCRATRSRSAGLRGASVHS
jgi:hypothetical protein